MTNIRNSTETILTFKKDDDDFENMSDWSVVWSTNIVPGMDMATGAGGSRRRRFGRRRLRLASLTLGCLMAMHARVTSTALTGGYFMFLMLLVLAVAMFANPMRHFEVYLGQWSLSGPGRAFRIIPMLDGIGIAICIHAIMRAVICVVIAGMMAIYLTYTTSDNTLPFTYCRNMDLKPYKADVRLIDKVESFNLRDLVTNPRVQTSRQQRALIIDVFNRTEPSITPIELPFITTMFTLYDLGHRRNLSVEVVHYRPDWKYTELNLKLLIAIGIVWAVLWAFMIIEKISHGRMIWNNMYPWILCIPWIWAGVLIFTGTVKFFSREKPLRNIFHIAGHKEVLDFVSTVFRTSTYIHAAALGSELIHGKGLNYYAMGHVDHKLNSDNVWHSCILLLITSLCTGGVSICAHTDYMQMKGVNDMKESSLWIFPTISKCSVGGNYGHFLSSLLFFGLLVSYMIVAFVCLKTALHTIFEYKVKLVFVEQLVVALLILACGGLSVIFTSNAGVGLLESVDVFLAGVATPMVCALELVGLLWVYRSRDFMSDMHVATEENACASRIGIQWQILPVFQIILLVVEALMVCNSELPAIFVIVGFISVGIILLALPLRACHNAYDFLQPPNPHHATS